MNARSSALIALLLATWIFAGEAVPVAPRATQPAGEKQTVEMPFLLSPDGKEFAPGENQAITRLIERHNANQDRLAKVSVRGVCVWNLDGYEGKPRQMRLEYDRLNAKAAITCGTESCQVEGAKVTAGAETLAYIDAVYLLMFRKYNPKDFKAAPAGQIAGKAVTVAKSDAATLEFDNDSGRLVRATVQTKHGALAANFENYAVIESGATSDAKDNPMLPTKVWLNVPDDFFPPTWARKAKITLTIEQKR